MPKARRGWLFVAHHHHCCCVSSWGLGVFKEAGEGGLKKRGPEKLKRDIPTHTQKATITPSVGCVLYRSAIKHSIAAAPARPTTNGALDLARPPNCEATLHARGARPRDEPTGRRSSGPTAPSSPRHPCQRRSALRRPARPAVLPHCPTGSAGSAPTARGARTLRVRAVAFSFGRRRVSSIVSSPPPPRRAVVGRSS